jgi:hypothetical protein
LRSQWRKNGAGGAIILMQARTEWGPFEVTHPTLECVILDKDARDQIAAILDSQQRKPKVPATV